MKAELILSLTKVAQGWRDPQNKLRQRAIAEASQEFCLSEASFALALDWMFSHWTPAKLMQLSFCHSREGGNPSRMDRSLCGNDTKSYLYAAQILAGNTPAMIAQGFLQGAILGIPQCIKVPHQQSLFAELLYQSFVDNAVPVAHLMEVNTWHNQLTQFYTKLTKADLVIAYGHDETMQTLKKQVSPTAIFMTHGHAESIAIISKTAATPDHLEKLAYDMLSYDQRGCLSPRITLIEQGGELSPAACAKWFAENTLPRVAKQLPRGGLFPGEAEEILHQRIVHGFYGPVYYGQDWTVCYSDQLRLTREALPRFMVFNAFENHEALRQLLIPLQKQLICIGYAGDSMEAEVYRRLLNVKCYALGEMQKQLLIF
jgi:hypothetical protein